MANEQEKIEDLLTELDNLEHPLYEYFDRIMRHKTRHFKIDLIYISAIDRSLALTFGFTTLIRSQNFQAAAHLVRLHLDNFLRLFAMTLVDDQDDFAQKFHSGVEIRKILDRDKEPMSDGYLKRKASQKHYWIDKVYTTTSGYVHLSRQHVMNSLRFVDPEKQLIEHTVGKTDRHVPDKARIDATECMMAITDCLLNLLQNWCSEREETP
jgi:hypothetical protein